MYIKKNLSILLCHSLRKDINFLAQEFNTTDYYFKVILVNELNKFKKNSLKTIQ